MFLTIFPIVVYENILIFQVACIDSIIQYLKKLRIMNIVLAIFFFSAITNNLFNNYAKIV